MENNNPFENFGNKILDFSLTSSNLSNREFYILNFMNWYANALCGAKQPSVDSIVSYFHRQSPGRGLPPVGRTESLSLADSVIVDGYSSVSLAYDDIHYETTLHPSAPVAAAIMGVARERTVSGMEFLKAYRIGLEVECRLAKEMFGYKSHTSAGWYVSGITGGVGAAAGTGYLLGLSRDQMASAIGLAASRAAGIRGSHGAMSTYLVQGYAAEAGFSAAYMALSGISGKIDTLTGKEGLMRMIAPGGDPEDAISGLGEQYVCEDTAIKPYPYGFVAHAVIACCQGMSEYIRSNNKDLKKLFISMPSVSAKLGSMWIPQNAFDAHTAIPYIAAMVMTDPSLAYEPVNENFAVSDEIRQMEQYINIIEDKTLRNSQAVCRAEFTDGSEKSIFKDLGPGSPDREMGQEAVLAKISRLIASSVSADQTDILMKKLLAIDETDDISGLLTF